METAPTRGTVGSHAAPWERGRLPSGVGATSRQPREPGLSSENPSVLPRGPSLGRHRPGLEDTACRRRQRPPPAGLPRPRGPGGAALWSGAQGRGLASCPQVRSLLRGQHLLTEWGPELAQGWGSAVLAPGLWGPTREGSAGRVSTQHPCPPSSCLCCMTGAHSLASADWTGAPLPAFPTPASCLGSELVLDREQPC